MNTHGCLYSLLGRLGGGARVGVVNTVVKFELAVVIVEVTRKSVGVQFVVAIPTSTSTGKVGLMLGPFSTSSTR